MSDTNELARQLAVIEERMETRQAETGAALERLRGETSTAFERLQAETSTAFERLQTDLAKRDADLAKRDKDNVRWQVGLWLGAVILIIAVLGVLIRLPVPG